MFDDVTLTNKEREALSRILQAKRDYPNRELIIFFMEREDAWFSTACEFHESSPRAERLISMFYTDTVGLIHWTGRLDGAHHFRVRMPLTHGYVWEFEIPVPYGVFNKCIPPTSDCSCWSEIYHEDDPDPDSHWPPDDDPDDGDDDDPDPVVDPSTGGATIPVVL